MTGSIDPFAARYAAVASNQTHRVEVIADTEDMAKSLLAEYRKATKILPERIIYLRDGVAEGQFAEILQVELPAIRQAAKAITGPTKFVKITVIIVKKRHHTRFFPASSQDGDRNGNTLPGTVIDTGITHPTEFDFCIFLFSNSANVYISYCPTQSIPGHGSSSSLSYVFHLLNADSRCNPRRKQLQKRSAPGPALSPIVRICAFLNICLVA